MDSSGREICAPGWIILGESEEPSLWDDIEDVIRKPFFCGGKTKVSDSSGKWGFIDEEGDTVGEIRWDEIHEFSEDLAAVRSEGLYGFIGQDGAVVIEPQYEEVSSFHEGLAAVRKKGEKWQYINSSGETVIEPLYKEVTDFQDGRADVCLDGTGWQVIDEAGSLIYFVSEDTDASYREAVKLLEDGSYEKAREAFGLLAGYLDSVELEKQAQADLLYEEGAYNEAYGIFKTLPEACQNREQDYKDLYTEAQELLKAGSYEKARTAFEAMSEYRDCRELAVQAQADQLYEEGSYDQAYEIYQTLPEAYQVHDPDYASLYTKAQGLLEAGSYDEAAEIFGSIRLYSDAASQEQESFYQKGLLQLENGEYEQAVETFEDLGDYSDAAQQVTESLYRRAADLTEKGEYDAAVSLYETMTGYRDVEDILKSIQDLQNAIWKKCKTGDTVIFGSYEQDGDQKNGPEAIEWIVVENDGTSATLVSKRVLDGRPFHEKKEKTNWERCSLRRWLNEDFYREAFSDQEKKWIRKSEVSAVQNKNHPETDQGGNTQDFVYLLSHKEVIRYFQTEESRSCKLTEWARKQGVSEVEGYGVWWLRPMSLEIGAEIVNNTGRVWIGGVAVNSSSGGVRPVIQVLPYERTEDEE